MTGEDGVIACFDPKQFEEYFADIGCMKRASDDTVWILSSSTLEYAPKNGWKRCTAEERVGGGTPSCVAAPDADALAD